MRMGGVAGWCSVAAENDPSAVETDQCDCCSSDVVDIDCRQLLQVGNRRGIISSKVD